MGTFTYVARDSTGQRTKGQLSAASRTEAARQLRAEGKFVVEIEERSASAPAGTSAAGRGTGAARSTGSGRVRAEDLIMVTTQLALMVDSGVPVAEALDGILRNLPPGGLRRVLGEVLHRVESGEPLSTALSVHPRVFGAFFVNLIRAAEMSGQLPRTLYRIAAHLATQRRIAMKVRQALMYPAFLALMALGAVIFMMTFLLPKFTPIYAGREELLPLPTKIVVGVSNALVHWWPIWVASAAVVVTAIILHLRTPAGRRHWDWLKLNLPIVGGMGHKAMITRSLHTLGLLIDSGVPMLDSVAITRRVVGNWYFERFWDNVGSELERGRQLSEPLFASPLFPRPLTQTIEAGERSGKLGSVLQKVSEWLETDLLERIGTATRLIEPLMILIIGSIVGGIAAAMLLPIFSFARTMSH
jgi:type IV pilus assembly protein PilC